jgi:hypothetical protein
MNGEGAAPDNVQDTTDGGQQVLFHPLVVRDAMMRPCIC